MNHSLRQGTQYVHNHC